MTCFRYTAKKLVSPAIILVAAAFSIPQGTFAQDRNYENRNYENRDYGQVRHLDPGARINVRANEPIDSRDGDRRFYRGIITDDVRGDNGRVVIPAGSPAELRVRVMPDNDLRLALRSVTVQGQQYRIETDPQHVEAQQQGGVIGGIIGALSNGEIGGREVRIPRDAVLTFRLESPLTTGRPDYDRNQDRDHYYDRDRNWPNR